jgi:hypothetical protein
MLSFFYYCSLISKSERQTATKWIVKRKQKKESSIRDALKTTDKYLKRKTTTTTTTAHTTHRYTWNNYTDRDGG